MSGKLFSFLLLLVFAYTAAGENLPPELQNDAQYSTLLRRADADRAAIIRQQEQLAGDVKEDIAAVKEFNDILLKLTENPKNFQQHAKRIADLSPIMRRIAGDDEQLMRLQLQQMISQMNLQLRRYELAAALNKPAILDNWNGTFDVEAMPKVAGDNSPEFRAAMYIMEKSKDEPPAARQRSYGKAYAIVYQAFHNHAIQHDRQYLQLWCAEISAISRRTICSLEHEQQNFADYVSLRKMEHAERSGKKSAGAESKSEALRKKSAEALTKSPRWQELDAKVRETAKAFTTYSMEYEKKEHPRSAEMRKIRDLMQAESAPAASSCTIKREKLDFSTLWQKTSYLEKDYRKKELEFFLNLVPNGKGALCESAGSLRQGIVSAEFRRKILETLNLQDNAAAEFYLLLRQARRPAADMFTGAVRCAAQYPENKQMFRYLFRNLPNARTPEALATYAKMLENKNLPRWVQEYLQGSIAQCRAWMARGYKYASQVSEKNMNTFSDNIALADKHFRNAAELCPGNPEIYRRLSGAPHSQKQTLEFFRKVTDIQADYPMLSVILTTFLPRWGGEPYMSFNLALCALKSPFRATTVPDSGIVALVYGAIEGNGYAWQRGIRQTPGLVDAALAFVRGKAASTDPRQALCGATQEVVLLTAAGRYAEAKKAFDLLTPVRFRKGLTVLDQTYSRISIGGSASYFSWVNYPNTLHAFNSPCGAELQKAEDIFLSGDTATALKMLEELLRGNQADAVTRRHIFYLYGHWMLSDDPCVARGRAVPAWHTVLWRNSREPIAEKMLQLGEDPNTRSENNCTLLMLAIDGKAPYELLTQIVEKRPELLHSKDNDADTPLHYAADKYPDARLVEFFLKHGADAKARNRKGRTPYDIAVLAGNRPAMELLKKKP